MTNTIHVACTPTAVFSNLRAGDLFMLPQGRGCVYMKTMTLRDPAAISLNSGHECLFPSMREVIPVFHATITVQKGDRYG